MIPSNKKTVSFFLTTTQTSLRLLIILFSFFFFNACKKEKKSLTEITIISPVAGFTTNVLDTFHVAARITASDNIQSVSVSVLDNDRLTVETAKQFYPSSDEYNLNTDYVITNKLIASGDYILNVNVVAGGRSTNTGVTIHVEGFPREMLGIYAVMRTDSFSSNLYKITNDSVNFVKNIPGDYIGCGISSIYNQFYSCGSISGPLNCFSLDDFSNIFSILPPNPPPLPSFVNYEFSEEKNFISYYNGAIKGFDHTGLQQYNTGDDPYFISDKTFKTKDYVIAQVTSTFSPQKFIAAYFYPSGVRRQIVASDFDVIGFGNKSDDQKIIFAMQNDYLLIYEYSIMHNNLTLMHNMGFLKLKRTFHLSDQKFIWLTESGMMTYDYSTLNPQFVTSPNYKAVTYDEVNNVVYAATDYTLDQLNHQTFVIIKSIALPPNQQILDLQILYNK